MPADQEQAYLDTLRRAYERIKQLEAALQTATAPLPPAPLAVVGMACRLPGGASSLEKYWELLAAGGNGVTEMPTGRWSPHYLDPTPDTPGRAYTTRAGYLTDIDGFDNHFFGIAPDEALALDPQQRLLLEVTAEALHHAGLPFAALENTKTGVFVGAAKNKYADGGPADSGPYTATGTTVAPLAGRLSYFLGLRGPSMTLDTACSSSLLAVHLAGQSLRSGESDYALVGGVNLILSPEGHISFSQLKALAPDGHCKTFDSQADGFGRGEGCGVLVLRRLADAERDGNRILGLVTGSATNHDGRSNGFTAPSQKAQEEVIRQALRAAGRTPADVDFVEAHGTGTSLGDAIEVKALHAVFSPGRAAAAPLLIGSVKANLGHLEYAAGVAGLIKVLLSLGKGEVPGQVHFKAHNPHISWDIARLQVPMALQPWPARPTEAAVAGQGAAAARTAGISGFGISGTNVHLVLESYRGRAADVAPGTADAETPIQANVNLLPVSAKTPAALHEALARLRAFVVGSAASVKDLGAQLAWRHNHFAVRQGLVAGSRTELLAELDVLLSEPALSPARADAPRVVLVFPGQGGQWAGMGRELYRANPRFRQEIAALEPALRPYLGWPLCRFFEADENQTDAIAATEIVQPLLFALQVALARLWLDAGVQPAAVLGNSMGEVAAAHIAGALSLADAAHLIGRRSQLLQTLAGQGAMGLLEWELASDSPLSGPLPAGVEVAAYNSPASVVLTGAEPAIEQIVSEFQARGLYARRLRVEVASHGRQMEALAVPLAEALAGLRPQAAELPFYSTVSGTLLTGPELDADYWYRNLRQPVQFEAAIGAALADGGTIFLEVSPHPTALSHVRRIAKALGRPAEVLPTLVREQPEELTWLRHLALLFAAGVQPRWAALYPAPGPFLDLPAYPWQRRRFWLQSASEAPLTVPLPAPTALHELQWRPAAALPSSPGGLVDVLLLHDGSPAALAALGRFTTGAVAPRTAVFGSEVFDEQGVGGWKLDGSVIGFERLLNALFSPAPAVVWLLGDAPASALPPDLLRLANFSKALSQSVLAQPLRLLLVGQTCPASAPDETFGLAPAHAAAFGLAKVLHAEADTLQISCLAADDASGPADWAAALAATSSDFLAVHHGGRRYLETLVPATPGIAQPIACQATGCYLISGGAAGLGLEFADYLARRGAQHLALLQRRVLPPRAEWDQLIISTANPRLAEQLQRYRAIETTGATLHFVTVDLADRAALAAALTMLRHAVGPIRGIIHAAAGSDNQFVAEQSAATFAEILNPKILGTSNLSELTLAEPLEFFVLFSSISALFHSGGQGAYVAGNAFLDQFARQARAAGRPVTAIAWPIWHETGRAAEAGLVADTVFKSISTEQGISLFEQALAAGRPYVVAGELNLDSPVVQLLAQAPLRLSHEVQQLLQSRKAARAMPVNTMQGVDNNLSESSLAGLTSSTKLPLEAQVRAVWQRVLGLDTIRSHDNFFALGGNSILATRIVNQLRQAFPDAAVSVVDVLKELTIGGLSDLIASRLTAEALPAPVLATAAGPAGLPPLRAVPLAARYPASQEQRRFWVQSQLDADSAIYNLTGAFRLDGPLDVPALERAVGQLMVRHATLRTTFGMADDELWQYISPASDFSLSVENLEQLNEEEAYKLSDVRIQTEARHSFNLSRGPLFRAGLLRLPVRPAPAETAPATLPAAHLLLLNLHHIVADGWALGVFTKELAVFYEAAVSQQYDAELAPLSLEYKDYAAWQQAVAQADALAPQREYWHHKLGGTMQALALPIDYARPATGKLQKQGDKQQLMLSVEATAALQVLANEQSCSLFMVVQAVLKIYLFRITGQADVVLGVPISVRPFAELEPLVGNFLNMLVLRDHLDETDSLLTVLAQVKATTLAAYDNQLYPYDQLVEELVIQRDLSRNPLFDVLFVFQNHEEAELRLGAARISPYYKETEHNKADLALESRVVAGCLQLAIEYNTDLFRPETIAALGADLTALLGAAPSQAAQPIAALPLGDAAGQAARAAAFNAPIAPMAVESTVWHRFAAVSKATPRAVALAQGDLAISYADLHGRALQLAGLLHKLVLGDEPMVAVACGGGPNQVVALLGIFGACGIYFPLNLSLPADLLGRQMAQATPQVLLCTAALATEARRLLAGLASRPTYLLVLDGEDAPTCYAWSTDNSDYQHFESEINVAGAGPLPEPAAACYLFATSGSTGQPKLILGSHRSLYHFIDWEIREFGFTPSVRVSQLIQPTFDAALRDVFVALCAGGTLVLPSPAERDDVAALGRWLARERISLIHTVPSVLRALLEADQAPAALPDLRVLILSGEPLPGRDVARWRERYGLGSELVNFYGATETTLIKTFYRVPGEPTALPGYLPAGRPLSHTRVAVVRGGRACAVGEVGEIYVKSPYFTNGYFRQENLTRQVFVQNPLNDAAPDLVYRSGDRGRLLADGRLEVLGRLDNQVKINGIRLELGEVEAACLGLPGVRQAVVLAPAAASGVPVLVAYLRSPESLDTVLLASLLRDKLPPYARPAHWVVLPEFPLTTNGKTDRARLPLPAALLVPAPLAADDQPQTPTEQALAALWAPLLKHEAIGRHHTFFELGGNSLSAMLLLPRIMQRFEVELTFLEFFGQPTVAGLAGLIAAKQPTAYAAIPALPPQARYEVSHAQQRMWILHHLEANSITYNLKRAFRLQGPLAVSLLLDGLRALVARHEALRTTFENEGMQLWQRIHPADAPEYAPVIEDISARPDPEAAARELANEEVNTVFDLARGPLLRARVLRLGADDHVFLFTLHHIIADGWTMEMLLRELFTGYNAARNGQPAALTAPPVQYKEYAAWQNGLLREGTLLTERRYWHKRLAGDIPVLELPTDFPRSAMKTYRGAPVVYRLSPALTARLKELAKSQEVSLFMLLLAGVKTLLHRYSGQRDLIVGAPIAGRDHTGLENVAGFFVNTLALRTAIEPDASFLDLLAQVRDVAVQAYQHQRYPFDKLVDDLQLSRDVSRSPLFDVTVQLLNLSLADAPSDDGPADVRLTRLLADWRSSQFDLSFFFKEEDEGLLGILEFNNSLYRPERIQRIISHLTALLEDISQHPARPLHQLDYLPADERAAVLHGFNRAVPALPQPLRLAGQLIERQAAIQPNAPALRSAAGVVTFAELDAQASRLARFLLAQAPDPAAPVAVLGALGPATVIALIAIHKAGKTYLPLDAAHPLDRLRYVLDDARPAVLLTLREHLPLANKLQWECASVQTYLCLDSSDIYAVEEAAAELMRIDLWNYVGDQAHDDIEAGGWSSSYTGLPLARADMDEYAANVLAKLRPHLRPTMRVLEIGCSSGITLFALAPFVAIYVGTDLSASILRKTAVEAERRGATNVELHTLRADEIDTLPTQGFDLVIINSVIQSFGGLNYLRDVVGKILTACADEALIFFGDVQDQTRKAALIASLEAFRDANPDRGFTTKTDWADELFLAPAYFEDLRHDFPAIVAVETSDKLGELRNELSLFRFDALLRVDKAQSAAPATPRHRQQLGQDALTAFALDNLPAPAEAAALAYLIYTSGTTGRPKGVAVSQGALANFVGGMHCLFENEIGPADLLLSLTKSTFDVSIFEIFVPLCAGATLCFADFGPVLSAETLMQVFIEQRVTTAFVPPALLLELGQRLVAQSRPVALGKLLVGVEPIASTTLDLFHQLNPNMLIVNGYGPTEATVCATARRYQPVAGATPGIVDIGPPLPNMQVLVLDEWQQPQGIGIPGELYVAGPALAAGYLNQHDLTSERFAPSPQPELASFGRLYRTGDLGHWQADGSLVFGGRADQQLKLRGYRIEAGEIEQQLLSHPAVQQAVVGTFVEAEGEIALAAWYVAADELPPARLREHLGRFLPEYMLPAFYVRIPAVPLTAHGKTDRARLPRPAALLALPDDFIAPTPGLETDLAALWQDILGLGRVGATANFFEIGGHSLKATRLVSRVFKDLELDLQLVEVFTHPTVRGQAGLLAARQPQAFAPLPRAPLAATYPLSDAQQRLWVIERLAAAAGHTHNAYNMLGASLLTGAVNPDLLSQSFAFLVARHESLRTNFVEVDHDAQQLVHPHRAFVLGQELAPGGPEDEAIAAAIRAESATAFDLENDPLLRCKLLTLSSQEEGLPRHLLLFSMHHIISDGWSMGVLLREFHAAYAALAQGQTPVLPALSVQYKDYAVWANEQAHSQQFAAERRYWHRTLAGPLPTLELPYDFERGDTQTFEGDTLTLRFTPEHTARLHALARQHEATLFMLAVALTNALLYRYSGTDDLIIGTPVAGRQHPDLEQQIGFYVNTLALRTQLAGTDTFGQLLEQVRRTTLDAFQHQSYPFNRLVEELLPRRDLSRFPFFDVMVVLQNNQVGRLALPGLTLTPLDNQRTVSRFDLNFMFEEEADQLVLQLQYNTSLFAPATAARMLEHLLQLASSALAEPITALDELEMLTAAEVQELLS